MKSRTSTLPVLFTAAMSGLLGASAARANPHGFPEYQQTVTVKFASPEDAGKAELQINPLPEGKTLAFTTRWDDSNTNSLNMAMLLKKHGLKGTFMLYDSLNSPNTTEKAFDAMKVGERIAALGMAVGNHSRGHSMPSFLMPNGNFMELAGFQADLESRYERVCVSYVYPIYNTGNNDCAPETPELVGKILTSCGIYSMPVTIGPRVCEITKRKPDAIFGTFLFDANDRNPTRERYERGFNAKYKEAMAHPCVKRITFGVHAWQDEAGLAVLDPVFGEQAKAHPELWNCTDNDYAAYRYSFFHARVKKLKTEGNTVVFEVTRFSPASLGADIPLSLRPAGKPLAATCGQHVLKLYANGDFDLPNDPDRRVPAKIGKTGAHGECEKFPGLRFVVVPDLKENTATVTLANNGPEALSNIEILLIKPPKWKSMNERLRAPELKAGATLTQTFPLGETTADPEYSEGETAFIGRVDFAAATESSRLYAVTPIPYEIKPLPVPRDTGLFLGPVLRESVPDNFLAANSVPGKKLEDFGEGINQKWLYVRCPNVRPTSVWYVIRDTGAELKKVFPKSHKTALCHQRRNYEKDMDLKKPHVTLICLEFEPGAGVSEMKVVMPRSSLGLYLNGKRFDYSGPNMAIPVRGGQRNRLIGIVPYKNHGTWGKELFFSVYEKDVKFMPPFFMPEFSEYMINGESDSTSKRNGARR